MNNPVEAAKARLVSLEEEAEKLRYFIAAYESVAIYIGAEAEPPVQGVLPVDKSDEDEVVHLPEKTPRATNPPPAVLIPAIIDALAGHGRPLSRKGIYETLKERGLVIQGTDPVKTLGTILWRNQNDIIQIEGYGYWPKALPYHRANYLGNGSFAPYELRP